MLEIMRDLLLERGTSDSDLQKTFCYLRPMFKMFKFSFTFVSQ